MGFLDSLNDYLDEAMVDQSLIDDYVSLKFGNVIIYNNKKQIYEPISFVRQMNNESNVIGIVVKHFSEINQADIILKNYLSTNGISAPGSYIGKEKHIPFYLKDLFNRYMSKYIKSSLLDISQFKFNIPEIQQLDYILDRLNIFKSTFIDIWGDERTENFFERFYKHGILSCYKQKYYQWLPLENGKREINNLTYGQCYELWPIFRFSL